jgi:hypothetical protein
MLNFRALLVFLAITVSLGLAGQLTPGTISISGGSTVCSGSTHGVLTSTVPTNTTGNVTYQWKVVRQQMVLTVMLLVQV